MCKSEARRYWSAALARRNLDFLYVGRAARPRAAFRAEFRAPTEEVAELSALFASGRCGFVTGQVLPIAGGWA